MFNKNRIAAAACAACLMAVHLPASAFIWSWTKNTSDWVTQTKRTSEAVNMNYDTVMSQDKFGANRHAPIDYYALAISWSPSYCASQLKKNNGYFPSKAAYQCEGRRHGWVLHGLWPQNRSARRVEDQPRFCKGDLPAVPNHVIRRYLREAPSASLLQGEWEKHGSCAFSTAEDYFDVQQGLFRRLNLPTQALSRRELFQWMSRNNPSLNGIRLGGGPREMYVCYDRSWRVMDCPREQFS